MLTETLEKSDIPTVREAVELTDAERLRYQSWAEDRVVRVVREAGYCREAEHVLSRVFGPPLDGNAYRDFDGRDCRGQEWRDADGYNRHGYDEDGFNRNGYNSDGFNRNGWDANGFNRTGEHRDDPSRYRYDRHGFTAGGFDHRGIDRNGRTPEQAEKRCVFDADGYDLDGYNYRGYNRAEDYSGAHTYAYNEDRFEEMSTRLAELRARWATPEQPTTPVSAA